MTISLCNLTHLSNSARGVFSDCRPSGSAWSVWSTSSRVCVTSSPRTNRCRPSARLSSPRTRHCPQQRLSQSLERISRSGSERTSSRASASRARRSTRRCRRTSSCSSPRADTNASATAARRSRSRAASRRHGSTSSAISTGASFTPPTSCALFTAIITDQYWILLISLITFVSVRSQRAHSRPVRKRQVQESRSLCGQFGVATCARQVSILLVLFYCGLQSICGQYTSASWDAPEAAESIASSPSLPQGTSVIMVPDYCTTRKPTLFPRSN